MEAAGTPLLVLIIVLVGAMFAIPVAFAIHSMLGRRSQDRRRRALELANRAASRNVDLVHALASWDPDADVQRSDAERSIRVLARCWVTWEHVPGRAVAVDSAAYALASGADSPALRELAGLSQRYSDEHEVHHLLGTALEELGVDTISPHSDEARPLALRHYCIVWARNGLDLHDLTSFAHEHFGHEGPLATRELVELDDMLDHILDARVSPRFVNPPEIVSRFVAAVADLLPTHPHTQKAPPERGFTGGE